MNWNFRVGGCVSDGTWILKMILTGGSWMFSRFWGLWEYFQEFNEADLKPISQVTQLMTSPSQLTFIKRNCHASKLRTQKCELTCGLPSTASASWEWLPKVVRVKRWLIKHFLLWLTKCRSWLNESVDELCSMGCITWVRLLSLRPLNNLLCCCKQALWYNSAVASVYIDAGAAESRMREYYFLLLPLSVVNVVPWNLVVI